MNWFDPDFGERMVVWTCFAAGVFLAAGEYFGWLY
jgi:hypothetical protein